MLVNFRSIPGQYKLFLDYLYDFGKVKEIYRNDYRSKEDYLKVFRNIAETKRDFRNDVPKIISAQYKDSSPSSKTEKNITLLREKNTLAVVTGQQLGILGGPLYTFYKIITVLKLASHLKERYDEYNFVPVFWLEGDDHDFDEIRSLNLPGNNNELIKISYEDQIGEDEFRNSVGYMKIKSSINTFFDSIDKNLRNTDFKAELLDKLKKIYSEGRTFKDSFRDLLFWIFDSYGLIIFDPQDVIIKNLLRPVFKKEIDDFRQHSEKLVNVSAGIEEQYHAQVKVQPINLFFSNEDGRFLIEPVDNDFRLKRKRRRFTYDELVDLLDHHPENFSSNVLLRPVCQDYLLPTAFYVGGPSEISYFAQVLPQYEFYNIAPPIIYPRASVTILEHNIESLLEKFGLNINDVFMDGNDLKNKILKSVSEENMDLIFNDSTEKIGDILDNLKENLTKFDKTIADSSIKSKQKIIQYVEELKAKALEAQKKKHEITFRQVDKLISMLYPNSNLQEREFNFVYFYNKYGEEFIKKIFEEISISKFEHQVIKL